MNRNGLLLAASLLLALAFTTFPQTAEAGKCGAKNQRPCKLWERVPSCDKGLVENFARGLCVAKAKPKPKPKPKAPACGAKDQRPCKVWERIPSCDKGLVENFARGLCLAKTAPPKPAAKNCGGLGATPCKVWERIPSCNKGLVEDFAKGKCVLKVKHERGENCGSLGGRPCTVVERIPSCDKGLVENFARGRCEPSAGTIRKLVADLVSANEATIRTLIDLSQASTTEARASSTDSRQRRAARVTQTNGRTAGPAPRTGFEAIGPPDRVADPRYQELYDDGFRLISEELMLDAGVVLGGNYSWGTVRSLPYLDCVSNFESSAWSLGASVGADATIGIGTWKIPDFSEFTGTAQSLTAAAALIGGYSYTFHFPTGTKLADMFDGKGLLGMTVAPQLGAGIEAEYGWGKTRGAEGCTAPGELSAPPSTPWG